jgi:predicted lipoprotein with Yx(FWY)xxD motif
MTATASRMSNKPLRLLVAETGDPNSPGAPGHQCEPSLLGNRLANGIPPGEGDNAARDQLLKASQARDRQRVGAIAIVGSPTMPRIVRRSRSLIVRSAITSSAGKRRPLTRPKPRTTKRRGAIRGSANSCHHASAPTLVLQTSFPQQRQEGVMSSKTSWLRCSLAAVATIAVAGGCSLGRPAVPSATSQPSRAALVSDQHGFTLYRLDESMLPVAQRRTDPRIDPLPDRRLLNCDAGTPPDWPIVKYQQGPTLLGVDRKHLGYLQRADGRRQLTINGCPVYRYRGDRTPGQTTGDGAAGTWFALRPAGVQ